MSLVGPVCQSNIQLRSTHPSVHLHLEWHTPACPSSYSTRFYVHASLILQGSRWRALSICPLTGRNGYSTLWTASSAPRTKYRSSSRSTRYPPPGTAPANGWRPKASVRQCNCLTASQAHRLTTDLSLSALAPVPPSSWDRPGRWNALLVKYIWFGCRF